MINRYKFCLWLVDKLMSKSLTLAEINELWLSSPDNINGHSVPPRTFLRYKALAEEIFNVNIECDKSRNTYRIDAETLDESDRWVMNALNIHNLASMAGQRRYIILEDTPAGQRLLEQAANACRDSLRLEFDYKSPYKPAKVYTVIPLFVKLFKQRWYLTCQPIGKDYLTTLALDRISNLKAGEKEEPSIMVEADEYFRDCYGIIHQLEPELIVVRAFWPQNAYLKEVPMHISQEVVDDTEEWTDFSIYVRPTYDLKQDLLWHRDKLAVLSPKWLKDDMLNILSRMRESYLTGLPHCKDE